MLPSCVQDADLKPTTSYTLKPKALNTLLAENLLAEKLRQCIHVQGVDAKASLAAAGLNANATAGVIHPSAAAGIGPLASVPLTGAVNETPGTSGPLGFEITDALGLRSAGDVGDVPRDVLGGLDVALASPPSPRSPVVLDADGLHTRVDALRDQAFPAGPVSPRSPFDMRAQGGASGSCGPVVLEASGIPSGVGHLSPNAGLPKDANADHSPMVLDASGLHPVPDESPVDVGRSRRTRVSAGGDRSPMVPDASNMRPASGGFPPDVGVSRRAGVLTEDVSWRDPTDPGDHSPVVLDAGGLHPVLDQSPPDVGRSRRERSRGGSLGTGGLNPNSPRGSYDFTHEPVYLNVGDMAAGEGVGNASGLEEGSVWVPGRYVDSLACVCVWVGVCVCVWWWC